MRQDNKNLLLAIGLSLLVLLGWNYFYGAPKIEAQRQTAQPSQALPPVVTPVAPAPAPRETVLERSPRIRIDTPGISGSIALRGGRIDDVALKNYHETVDPRSPNIVLFSPSGSAKPYYADFGWIGAPDAPNADSLWTSDETLLTPEQPVTLRFDAGKGLVFTRTIAVDAKAMFTVRDSVENRNAAPVTLYPYGLVSRHGKPETLGYYVLHEGMTGVLGDAGLQEYTYSALEKEPLIASGKAKIWKGVKGGFIGITDKYWAAALIPDQTMPYDGRFSVSGGASPVYQADLLGAAQIVQPGETAGSVKQLFAGAKEVATIDLYEKNLGIKSFDLLIDWGWFYFITKPLFKVLDYFYHLFGNFGVSILLVTVLLKLVFFPLASKSYASMAKMKAVQPEMANIRDRYKDDKLKQQQELMDLYKREKINPVAGCWPVLIQIPVFFALYKVLFVTIEMRHAPFFGWIKDLAAPDPTSVFNLFGLLPISLPAFLTLGIWPIIMGVTMFLQMKMNPEPTDPIQKTMFSWMPIVFTFMLAAFPAGLVIYWAWNNFLSITQQYFIMKKNGVKVELWDNIRGMVKRPA